MTTTTFRAPILNRLLDWQGHSWWWTSADDAPNQFADFRARFALSEDPSTAWLAFAADTSAKVFVNGAAVHFGPPREVSPFAYYDVVDLRPFLRAGANEVLLVAHHQGAPSASHVPVAPGVMLDGLVEAGSERVVLRVEAGAWQARVDPRYAALTHRLGGLVGFSEEYRFAAESDEAGWASPEAVGAFGAREPRRMLARDLPALDWAPQEPAVIEHRDDGASIDFGQMVFGFLELEIEIAAPDGGRVEVLMSECMKGGLPDYARYGCDYRDVLVLPAVTESAAVLRWTSYEKRAMQYLRIAGPCRVRSARVWEYRYPLAAPALGRCADAFDRRVCEISARTIQINMDDLLNDGPWRERTQALDPFFCFDTLARLFGTTAPVRRFLTQFGRGAQESGLLQMYYPSSLQGAGIPDFSLSYALAVRKFADLGGDDATLAAAFPVAARAVECFAPYEDADGLLGDVPGWTFLDNTWEICKVGRSAGLNAIYAAACAALADVAGRLGRGAGDAAAWRARFDRIRASWRRVFLRMDEQRVLDSDRSAEFERRTYWNYHHAAATGRWDGGPFRLSGTLRFAEGASARLAVHAYSPFRLEIDGRQVLNHTEGFSWSRSPIYAPVEVPGEPLSGEHTFAVEADRTWVEWEVFLSSEREFDVAATRVTDATGTAWDLPMRRYYVPRLAQTTVGIAAYCGMLEDAEALALLRRSLPEEYWFNYLKRVTPFFARETGDAALLRNRVVPTNCPAGLFYFAYALRKYGLEAEARTLLRRVYRPMVEAGASTWWEEWGPNSSHCHMWGAYVADFLMQQA